MKKWLAAILALVLLLGLAGCSDGSGKPIKVGIAAPDVTHGWVAGVAYYAEKYCKDNGIAYSMTISSDAEEMTSHLQSLVAEGCTVIVAWPQWEGMEEAMQAVIDQGVPVVAFDVDVDCEDVFKVTGDNFHMGTCCAEYITGIVAPGSTVVVLDVPTSGSVCKLRKEGFYHYLEENGISLNTVEYQLDSFARGDSLAAMEQILQENPQIDAIFSMDDETSIGAITAILEAGRTDVQVITGGGGSQEYFRMIADENFAQMHLATALYSPSMVIDAIQTAIALLEGGRTSKLVMIPTTIVTKENVSEYLDMANTVY